uniref:Uncharacterized protein n=1 Tax=Eutreptiella gymnastica TaxID=73025 RepID=A0A7S4G0F8_9EUGL|mmetsp:Transcript_10153/g.19177  ORF Transcript_10153/g.19177 Transcript_10153/m.19177 type:complete len:163 (+) Transcript_10153:684-1172(+)
MPAPHSFICDGDVRARDCPALAHPHLPSAQSFVRRVRKFGGEIYTSVYRCGLKEDRRRLRAQGPAGRMALEQGATGRRRRRHEANDPGGAKRVVHSSAPPKAGPTEPDGALAVDPPQTSDAQRPGTCSGRRVKKKEREDLSDSIAVHVDRQLLSANRPRAGR